MMSKKKMRKLTMIQNICIIISVPCMLTLIVLMAIVVAQMVNIDQKAYDETNDNQILYVYNTENPEIQDNTNDSSASIITKDIINRTTDANRLSSISVVNIEDILESTRAYTYMEGRTLNTQDFDEYTNTINSIINNYSKEFNIDPILITLVIDAENYYRQFDSISPSGAIGIMQIMPEVAQDYGIDANMLTDPNTNIRLGTMLISKYLNEYDRNIAYVLSSYNWGPNATKEMISKNQRLVFSELPAETKYYMEKIIKSYILTIETN